MSSSGGDGIENVSVVKSELMPGFSLKRTLGDPKEAAEKILSTVIAPPDSGEVACLFCSVLRGEGIVEVTHSLVDDGSHCRTDVSAPPSPPPLPLTSLRHASRLIQGESGSC